MRRILTVSLPFLMIACAKPAAEAPEDFQEVPAFLFANFDSESGDELRSGLVEVEAYLDGLDLAGDIENRTIELPILTSENWGGINGNSDFDGSAQIPRGVAAMSRHDLPTNKQLALETNHVCIESDTTVYAGRTFLSGDDCFPDSCDRVNTFNEIRKENFLAQVWFDVYKDFRVITLDDGREAMVSRSWMEEQFMADGGNNSWDELYGMEIWIPTDDGQNKRFYAFWSSVTLSAVGDDLYGRLVRDGIDQGYQFADAFLDGSIHADCPNDRDRAYDRN
ncbi:MAG: hypothetical protein EP330_03955 [Deltaproteobacteria bacterium]|nr:MAG: hypothetical protein EP330_03955 [Deltaproteobacteria bacterium]